MTGIISHDVEKPRDVVVLRDVPKVTLVEGSKVQEICVGGRGGARALVLPGNGSHVVTPTAGHGFHQVVGMGNYIMLGNGGS